MNPPADDVVDPGRFELGDHVRVRTAVPAGNPRTPSYLHDRVGTVVQRHGVVLNPLDHPEPYPALYSVVFALANDAHGDEVLADLHEEWLEPAVTDPAWAPSTAEDQHQRAGGRHPRPHPDPTGDAARLRAQPRGQQNDRGRGQLQQ
jgi:hypothetical protein